MCVFVVITYKHGDPLKDDDSLGPVYLQYLHQLLYLGLQLVLLSYSHAQHQSAVSLNIMCYHRYAKRKARSEAKRNK